MAEQHENRMPVVVERGLPKGRELLSVPLHRDLGIFSDYWTFPRAIGRVLPDGSVEYDQGAADG